MQKGCDIVVIVRTHYIILRRLHKVLSWLEVHFFL